MTETQTEDRIRTNQLLIRLRSDLCPGSGEGFLSGIDSDVCYDQHGIPVIPGRRLKGCLRQAARDIDVDPELMALIFGTPGSSESGLLTVLDARLDVPECMVIPQNPADALDLFTYTRAQTKLDPATGTASEGSLRYTRVVRHYLSAPNADAQFQESTFHARLELRDLARSAEDPETAPTDEKVRAAVGRIALALKNVGLCRNRGLGAVACRLQDAATWKPARTGVDEDTLVHAATFEERHGEATRSMVAISYMVHLDGPVMLPQQNAGRSQIFIPGTSVQGFFASHMASLQQSKFNDTFLGDKVRFSPLYPMDNRGERCLPTPPFVVRLKGGTHDGYHWNGLYIRRKDGEPSDETEGAWAPTDGEQILKLEEGVSFKPGKGGFVGSDWLPMSVRKTVAYHHSTGETTNDEGTLYTQECLEGGQVFGGYVECVPELAPSLRAVLESGVARFGRSKSAQYGRCSVIRCDRDLSGREGNGWQTLEPGIPYAYLLESDTALLDTARATYTTDANALCSALSEAASCDLRPHDLLLDATNLDRRTVGGYNAKWNQKRPQAQVLACGSAVSFVAESEIAVPAILTVGERQAEGYGRVRLVRIDRAITPPLDEQRQSSQEGADESQTERCRAAAIAYAKGSVTLLSELTASMAGRLSLMARQATSLDDLNARVSGIADDKRRKIASNLVGGLVDALKNAAGGDPSWRLTSQCLVLLFRYAKYNGKLVAKERDDQ